MTIEELRKKDIDWLVEQGADREMITHLYDEVLQRYLAALDDFLMHGLPDGYDR